MAVKIIERTIIALIMLGVSILPLQEFRVPFASGLCLLLLLLWAIGAVLGKNTRIVWTRIHTILVVFLILVVVQLIPWPFTIRPWNLDVSFEGLPASLAQWNRITIDPQATARAGIALASVVGLFFITVNVLNSERRIRLLVDWLIFSGLAISLLGILDKFSPPEDPLLRGANPLGLFYFSLGRLAGYLEMVFPLPLAMIVSRASTRAEWIWWYAFAMVAIGVGVAAGDTVGGLFVLGIEIVVFFMLLVRARVRMGEGLYRGRSRIWAGMGAAATVAAIIAGTAWLGAGSSLETMRMDVSRDVQAIAQVQQEEVTPSYQYTRVGIWRNSLPMIADHPFFGLGLGTYPLAFMRYDPGTGADFVNAAHNDYLQLVCETGLIGGVIMLMLLITLGRLSLDLQQREHPLARAVTLGASVGCLGILVHSLIDFHLQSMGTSLLFLMLIGLLVGVKRIEGPGSEGVI